MASLWETMKGLGIAVGWIVNSCNFSISRCPKSVVISPAKIVIDAVKQWCMKAEISEMVISHDFSWCDRICPAVTVARDLARTNCFKWAYHSLVAVKLCHFLNRPEWETWKFSQKDHSVRASWNIHCSVQSYEILASRRGSTTSAVSFCCILQQVAAPCSGVTPLLCADCSTVQDRLSKVQQLQATERAFAAILADGLVTTWGDRCRQTPRCCGLIFFWQRTSRQLQRCHSAAFSSRLLPNAAEWHRCCVPTVPQCKIGSAKCSNFKQQSVHLPRYWPMDWWLPGAIDADKRHVAVVSFFSGRGPPDNYSGVIPRHFPAGCCQMQRSNTAVVVCRLFHSARLAQQSAATSSHRACICRDIGRWIGDYLGWSRLRWWRFCSRRPHIPSLLHVPKPYFSGKPKTFCWLRMVTTHSTRNTHDWIIYNYDILIFLKIS